jgi:hypothetical protein
MRELNTPAANTSDAARPRQRQEFVEGGLIEQRVAARQHHAVELPGANEIRGHVRLVYTNADRLDVVGRVGRFLRALDRNSLSQSRRRVEVSRQRMPSPNASDSADRPIGAEHAPIGAEDVEDLVDIRREVVRLPGLPVDLGYHPRQLAPDVPTVRPEATHQLGPGLESLLANVRLKFNSSERFHESWDESFQ